MILNADINEAFLNVCLYGWYYADIFVCLVRVCLYFVLYVVHVSSYRLCCLPFPSCSVLEFFDGWQILIIIIPEHTFIFIQSSAMHRYT